MSDKAKRLNLPLRADRITILDARGIPLAAVSALGYSSEEDEEIAAAIVDAVNASVSTAPREKGKVVATGPCVVAIVGGEWVVGVRSAVGGEHCVGQLVEVRLCEGEGRE